MLRLKPATSCPQFCAKLQMRGNRETPVVRHPALAGRGIFLLSSYASSVWKVPQLITEEG
jgi:hypothetical protein